MFIKEHPAHAYFSWLGSGVLSYKTHEPDLEKAHERSPYSVALFKEKGIAHRLWIQKRNAIVCIKSVANLFYVALSTTYL